MAAASKGSVVQLEPVTISRKFPAPRRYTEIEPDHRLVIDMNAVGDRHQPLFRAYTVVNFIEEADGTRLEVDQRYTVFDPAATSMIQGAPQGWSQTLDRLEIEIARMQERSN